MAYPLAKGWRVLVTADPRYRQRCLNRAGTVMRVYSYGNIAVQIDGLKNQASTMGYFYFSSEYLTILTDENKGENHMEKITNYLNVAKVTFINDSTPFHSIECANFEPLLQEGDLCIVKTARHGIALAEVAEITDRPSQELLREIVAKVDTSDYDTRVEQRQKAAELKAKMQERAKQLQDIVLYQTLAKEDPTMAQLLEDYQAINK